MDLPVLPVKSKNRVLRYIFAALAGAGPMQFWKDYLYRLWLSDPLALSGVENAKFTPG